MAYGITIYNMPACSSYADAKEIWAGAQNLSKKPAWGENTRPLENKRMRHKAITKHADGSFSFDLYKTEMVRYYPDGRVGGTRHESLCSRAFFGRMSPAGVSLLGSEYHHLVYVDTPKGGTYINPANNTFMLKPAGEHSHTWEVISETLQRTRRVANRKRAAEVRKGVAGLFAWADVAQKLSNRPVWETIYWRVVGLKDIEPQLPLDPALYLDIAKVATNAEAVRIALYDYFGVYERHNIPNSEKPCKSKIAGPGDT